MSNPNVFPDAHFPYEYWVIEYWPISAGGTVVVDTRGCVDLNDWLNYDVTMVDEVAHNVALLDTSDGVAVIDILCPN